MVGNLTESRSGKLEIALRLRESIDNSAQFCVAVVKLLRKFGSFLGFLQRWPTTARVRKLLNDLLYSCYKFDDPERVETTLEYDDYSMQL